MYSLYKANKNITGSACGFQYNSYNDTLFVTMTKQVGWNPKGNGGKGTGTFKNSPTQLLVKFNINEIATMINTIERNTEFKIWHTSDKGKTTGQFTPYIRNDQQIGYSLGLTQSDAGSDDRRSVAMGFTFSESVLLRQFLISCLDDYAKKEIKRSTDYNKRKFEETKKENGAENSGGKGDDDWNNWDFAKQPKKENPAPTEPEPQEQEEDDDTPF